LQKKEKTFDRNPFLPQKKHSSNTDSSTSSNISSNEENDPGKELIRIEKRKLK
jgi:hypothetical protein